jgi:very-short-patch-repair endonuclease
VGNKLTTDIFIERSKNIHKDEYNYDLVNYVRCDVKVKIICPQHGIFEQIPSSHLDGQRCPVCYGTPRKKQDEIINKCKKIHNNKYDYSLVEYKSMHSKMKIICPKHGIFEQCSRSHLRGHGCPYCAGLSKYNNETFIKKFIEIHNNKYDYSLVNYINRSTKIKIICPFHGIFEQFPSDHLMGCGCPSCSKKFRYNSESFIKKSIEIHGEKYDYSLVNYKNNKTKVKIICPIHGLFETRPDNHLNQKNGCPKCSESIGEKKIREILTKNSVVFETEKSFEGCKYKHQLKFDFYLPNHNTCIEFDGQQHFKKWEKWNDRDVDLENRIKRDKIKNQFCLDNNIKLLRIRYDEDIKEKLFSVIPP